jgi:hypothetical protein
MELVFLFLVLGLLSETLRALAFALPRFVGTAMRFRDNGAEETKWSKFRRCVEFFPDGCFDPPREPQHIVTRLQWTLSALPVGVDNQESQAGKWGFPYGTQIRL